MIATAVLLHGLPALSPPERRIRGRRVGGRCVPVAPLEFGWTGDLPRDRILADDRRGGPEVLQTVDLIRRYVQVSRKSRFCWSYNTCAQPNAPRITVAATVLPSMAAVNF
jgi:hypothetical protein